MNRVLPIRSVANMRPQEHNCPNCWDCDPRGCSECEGTGRLPGSFAPVDALAQWVHVSRGLHRHPNAGDVGRLRRRNSLQPSAGFAAMTMCERAIRMDLAHRQAVQTWRNAA